MNNSEGKMEMRTLLQNMSIREVHRVWAEVVDMWNDILNSMKESKVFDKAGEMVAELDDENKLLYFMFLGERYFVDLQVKFVQRDNWMQIHGLGEISVWRENKITEKNDFVCKFDLFPNGRVPELGIEERNQKGRDTTIFNGILVGIVAAERERIPPKG